MNPSLMRAVLLSTYWEQSNRGRLWVVWMIFGLAIVGGALPLIFMRDQPKAWELSLLLFSVISCGNVVLWWFALSSNLIRLASPTVKPLQPRCTHAIIAVYAISWLASTVVCALAFMWAHGPFFAVFFFTGLGLLLVTLVWGAGNWLWGIPLYLNGFWFRPALAYGEKLVSIYGAPLVFSIAIAGLIAFFCLSVRIIFFRKGDRAFAAHMKLIKRIDTMAGNLNPNKIPDWQQQINGRWLYDWSLQRSERRSIKVDRQNVLRFLAYGFGPGFHWSLAIGFLVWIVVSTLIMIVLPGEYVQIGRILFSPNGLGVSLVSFVVLMMILGGCQRGLITLHQTRKEQQLLCLLPVVPSRSALGRAVMTLLLRQAAMSVAFGVLTAMLCVLLILHRLPSQTMMEIVQATLISCAALFFLFPDFSRMGNPALRGVVMMLAGLFLYIALNVLNFVDKSLPISLIGSVFVAVAACLYAIANWRGIPQRPTPLPVGRFA